MPCYLFSYHAYGSWLPDREEGYVDRLYGQQSKDVELAKLYRRSMCDVEASIEEPQQLAAIDAILEGVTHIECVAHSIATETTHVHTLVSWTDERRTWRQNRNSLKKAITIKLQAGSDRKLWLSEGASRKRVKTREHFDHLVERYLPSHRGWKWDEKRGLYK